jgi:hypothetical protein
MDFSLHRLRIGCASLALLVIVIAIILISVGASKTNGSPMVLGGVLLLTVGLLCIWIGYILIRSIHAHQLITQMIKAQASPNGAASPTSTAGAPTGAS